ncbi:MAG: Small-conductance mechanosensitive ion channel-like protein, partial [Parcubacteria group bacterium GW2011_GWA1_40_21]
VLQNSFQDIGIGLANFIPNLFVAIVIFIVGWIIGSILGKVVGQIISSLKIDNALKSAGVGELVAKAGFNLNAGAFIGGLIKWFFIIVFLVAALDVLKLTQVNQFLQNVVLSYLPQVIVAMFILLVAVVIAEAMQKVVVGSAKAANIKSANFLGAATKWAIWIFAILTTMIQLGIAVSFIQTLFTGVIIAFSLAIGLSFGLGGQEAAAGYIEKIRHEIADRKHGE